MSVDGFSIGPDGDPLEQFDRLVHDISIPDSSYYTADTRTDDQPQENIRRDQVS